MTDRRFFGIFCDDVRLELGGKYSLMGCYGTDLGVPEFPFFMPKLCFSFTLMFAQKECPENAEIIIRKDGDEFFKIAVTEQVELDSDQQGKGTYGLAGGFDMIGVRFEEPCTLQAEVRVNGSTVSGPKLQVHAITPQENELH